ncbi:MAG: phage tail protein I [Vibrio sp.]
MLDLRQSLLPIASFKEEHAASIVAKEKLEFDFSSIDTSPKTCDAKLLPWLAYQWRVNIAGLTEKEQRALISNAREIHQYKGTVHAVKLALASVFASSAITEFSGDRAFEFDAKVALLADPSAYYYATKFVTARELINQAKNARSRFVDFQIEMPVAKTPIVVQTALKWDLEIGSNQ